MSAAQHRVGAFDCALALSPSASSVALTAGTRWRSAVVTAMI